MSAAGAFQSDPRRGEVWMVSFNPQSGAEIGKTRPAVVISLDSIGVLPLRIVVPITEWSPRYAKLPWMVNLKPANNNGLSKESAADTFQVKSVSLDRFGKRLGRLEIEQSDEIAQIVAFCVGA